MPESSPPPFYRRQFGAKLRRLREQAGFTLDEAALPLDKTRSALHRIETGDTRADVHLLQSMLDLYSAYDPTLLDEARQAAQKPWYRKHGLATAWHIDVETNAAQVQDFSPHTVPALLRSEPYAAALLAQQDHTARDKQIAVLKIRQQRLTDEHVPLQLITVVDEFALRRTVGGPATMRDQLLRLAACVKLPTVTLRVLPHGSNTSALTMGAFTLGTMPDTEVPALLHIEHVAGSLYVEDAETLTSVQDTFEQLCAAALCPDDSIALIEGHAARLIC